MILVLQLYEFDLLVRLAQRVVDVIALIVRYDGIVLAVDQQDRKVDGVDIRTMSMRKLLDADTNRT